MDAVSAPVVPAVPILAAPAWGRAAVLHLVLLLSLAPAPVLAQQSADDILAAVRDGYDQRAKSVENYSVVQEVGGEHQVAYYERRERDGHAAYEPVGPFSILIQSGALDQLVGVAASGGVLSTLRSGLEQSAAKAGLGELSRQVQAMDNGVFTDFVGPLLTPEPGQPPGAALASLTSPDHLKAALLKGAKKAALHEAEKALLGAAAPQLGLLLDGLKSPGGAGEMLHQLGDMLAQGTLPIPSQMFGGGQTPGSGGMVVGNSGMSALIGAAGVALGAVMVKGMEGTVKKIDQAPGLAGIEPPPPVLADELTGHAALAGTEAIDGHDCWVLEATDAAQMAKAAGDHMRDPKLTVWIDRELALPRRLRIEGQVKMQGSWQPMVVEMDHDDFREAGGLMLPYRTSTQMSGMSTGMSDKDRKKMQEHMAEMQKQLAKMPPERRAMVEQMLKSRMPQMQAMLGDSAAPVETVVKQVEVNQGPPAELVAQAKAMMKETHQ